MSGGDPSTLQGCVDLAGADRRFRTRRRVLYAVTTTTLTLVIALAVLEAAGVVAVYGMRSATVRAEGGGYRLEVTYGRVSRPALATPLRIEVTRPGGFDAEQIDLSLDLRYFSMWDTNGINPAPAEETTRGDELLWTFELPDEGDTFVVSYDARIGPNVQRARSTHVAVLDDRGAEVVRVELTTQVRP